MKNIEKTIQETSDILNENINKILNRGEDLNVLIEKSDKLKDLSALFKKTAKKLNKNLDNNSDKKLNNLDNNLDNKLDDYLTENEDTSIKEYEEHLKMLLDKDEEVQYVLDKASQLGLIDIIKYVIDKSKYHQYNLYINNALINASSMGHIDIVELLLDHDIDNEMYYGRKPELHRNIFNISTNKLKIPFSNLPLLHNDLVEAKLKAILNKHLEIEKVLEKYYFRSFAIKDRHNMKPPVPLNYELYK